MKTSKLLKGLLRLAVLALFLFVSITGSPVRAASPQLTAEPASNEAGTVVQVTGVNFTPGYYGYLFFNEIWQSSRLIGSNGDITLSLVVPAGLPPGDNEIALLSKSIQDNDPSYADTD